VSAYHCFMTGRFITFEGGEGSGKSTQARLLATYLRSRGIAVVETREPGGSPFAEALRNFILDPATPPHAPLSEALLFTAARADHLDATIRPALARSDWVICDRFTDSTRVYQGAAGGLADAALATLESLVVGDTRPDLTVLMDLDAATGLARARERAGGAPPDGYEARGLAYHDLLRKAFLARATAEPSRIAVIDAARPIDLIADGIRSLVATRFGPA